MQVGDIVYVDSKKFFWDRYTKQFEGLIEDKNFVVPTDEIFLQSIRWTQSNCPREIKRLIKSGIHGVVKEIRNERVIISIKDWQRKVFDEMKVGEIYEGSILYVAYDAVYVSINTLTVRVWATECSRARMFNMRDFFKTGTSVKLKITHKHEQYQYQISGSIKEAYPTIDETTYSYKMDEVISVKACERLNEDGCWAEVTPGIPGILNAPEEEIDQLKKGEIYKAKIEMVKPIGIKCRLVLDSTT